MMNKTMLLAAASLFSVIAADASAQVTAYTDKAAFTAAATSGGRNVQTETFSSATAGNFASSGGVFNAAFDGFSITGQNFGNYVGIATGVTANSGVNTPIPASFLGQNYLTWANIAGGIVSLTINLNSATTAFGFDWFNTDVTDQYNVAVAGGQNYSGPPFTVGGNTGFFGLVSTTPFTSIVITNNFNGGYISDEGMDNFITNGQGSANGGVPEPATWAMMLLGVGALGAAMRRRTKTAVRLA